MPLRTQPKESSRRRRSSNKICRWISKSCACWVNKWEFSFTTKCQQILKPTPETKSHSLWKKKTIFNPMDHQHTSANDYCFDCRLYTRASFTITCYFDFINIYCNTSFLVNNAIPLMSNVNIWSKLNIFYQNVHGLRAKLTDIRSSIVLLNNYDIIIPTESWLFPNFIDFKLCFHGFQIFRQDFTKCLLSGWRCSYCCK